MNFSQSDFLLLTARFEKLEKQNRWWKIVNGLLLLSGVSIFLMGAKSADRIEPQVLRATSVEAQNFILRDADGHIYAQLSLNSGKTELPGRVQVWKMSRPALEFYDRSGDIVWTAPTEPVLLQVK
jgi:hypothetical protein